MGGSGARRRPSGDSKGLNQPPPAAARSRQILLLQAGGSSTVDAAAAIAETAAPGLRVSWQGDVSNLNASIAHLGHQIHAHGVAVGEHWGAASCRRIRVHVPAGARAARAA